MHQPNKKLGQGGRGLSDSTYKGLLKMQSRFERVQPGADFTASLAAPPYGPYSSPSGRAAIPPPPAHWATGGREHSGE